MGKGKLQYLGEEDKSHKEEAEARETVAHRSLATVEVFGEVSLEDGYFGSGGVVTNAGRVVQVGAFSVCVAAHCVGSAWVWWRYIGNTSPGDGFSWCNIQTAFKFGLLFRAIKVWFIWYFVETVNLPPLIINNLLCLFVLCLCTFVRSIVQLHQLS